VPGVAGLVKPFLQIFLILFGMIFAPAKIVPTWTSATKNPASCEAG
jgi:hypothetical protein